MLMLIFGSQTIQVEAAENENTITYILSDELVDAGYRMTCNAASQDIKECIYDQTGKRAIGQVQYVASSAVKVPAYPAINNGVNWTPQDVEFRINNEAVSRPKQFSGHWGPTPINQFMLHPSGTVFVAHFRSVAVNYYDDMNQLVKHETLRAGENAMNSAGIIKESNVQEDMIQDYSFDKWLDTNGNEINFNDVRSTINAYASYTTKNKYAVTYMNDDQVFHKEFVEDGSSYELNEVPTKANTKSEDTDNVYEIEYTFDHWENVDQSRTISSAIQAPVTYKAVYNTTQITTKKPSVPSDTTNDKDTSDTTTSDTIVNDTTINNTPVIQNIVLPQTSLTEEAQVATIDTTETDNAAVKENLNTEEIKDDTTPLAGPVDDTWAFMNLVFALATLLLGCYALLKKEAKSTIAMKLIAVVAIIASIALFFTTQNLTANIALLDNWSIIMAMIVVIQIGMIAAQKKITNK